MHKKHNSALDVFGGISLKTITRALTPLFGNWAGALGIGKISGVSTKIGKIYIVYMYEVSISRLIQIVNLTLFLEIIYKITFNYWTVGTYLIQEQFWFRIYLIFSMGIKWEDSN